MEQMNTFGNRAWDAQIPKEERLEAFKQVIAHPHLIAVEQAVHEAIRETGGALLIFACGPTGVGKTIMKNHVIRQERAPILSLSARPPLNGSFAWKDFLQSGILALEHLSIGRKIALSAGNNEEGIHSVQPREALAKHKPLNRATDMDLRISLETAMKRRHPAAVIIDDAQYLGRVSGGRQLQNQVDCLKSLAEITETVHVLIGTYELLQLHYVSAQAVGRSVVIHFPRYGSSDEELSQFKAVLRSFQELLPFEEETNILLKHWEFCYERSLGCVGTLYDMLVRAVHAALWADEKRFSEKYLRRYALSEAACYAMIHEIYEAEREMAFRPASTELRQMLGLAPHAVMSQEVSDTRQRPVLRVKEHTMLFVAQFESHKNELPYIHQFDHDDNVLEYYDQPPFIKLSYILQQWERAGRRVAFNYMLNFFLIKKDAVGCREFRRSESLCSVSMNSTCSCRN